MKKSNLAGLILSGGSSSRMGGDKALIQYHGMPQRAFLFHLLNRYCDEVYLSCKVTATIPENLHPLPDRFHLESPLNGILTAFHKHPDRAWLTAPIDMPLIDDRLISYLLEHRDRDCLATCFYDADGSEPEPLLCVWESHAFEQLTAFFRDGNFSPRQFLKTNRTKILEPPFAFHLNINTPEELEQFRRRGV